jgi:hypothetical protein
MMGTISMPYRVCYAERVKSQLRELWQTSSAAGIGDEVAKAIQTIESRLVMDPLTFGEASHHLGVLDLEVRRGAVAPLLVYYAVDEDQHIVYALRFMLLPR